MHTLNIKTKGLCNVCYREIPARVYEKDGQILIRKACPRHGAFTGLVENNPRFYRWFTSISPQRYRRFTTLLLPVTYRCNLSCNYCFSHYPSRSDLAIGQIMQAVKAFNGKYIELSGGEPTLREDLPLIIKTIKGLGKNVILETNGLKLADIQYLRRLKKAGLDQILFSFDSLQNSFYKKISASKEPIRQNILSIKRKAIMNLRRESMPSILSVTVYRGLNDQEIKDLFIFAMRYSSCITQIRFRSFVNLSGSKKNPCKSYTLSELCSLFSKQLHIDEEDLKTDFLKSRLGRSVILYFEGYINKRKFIPYRHVFRTEQASSLAIKKLEVKIISWPTVENIDLRDLKTTMVYLTYKKRLLKFFYGVVRDSRHF